MGTYTVSTGHRLHLNGKAVRYEPPRIPVGAPMTVRRLLIMHFTAGWGLESTIYWWRQSAAKGTNAHIIIDRDGTVAQCRPFNQTAGHAGASSWRDRNTGITHRNLNSCSLGIELCNAGAITQSNYPLVMEKEFAGKPIPFMESAHKNGGKVMKWEIFPQKQLDVALEVAATLVKRYNLDDVLGHDDVAPNRKTDPGPAFPLTTFRSQLGFDYPI